MYGETCSTCRNYAWTREMSPVAGHHPSCKGLGQNYLPEKYPGEFYPEIPAHTGSVFLGPVVQGLGQTGGVDSGSTTGNAIEAAASTAGNSGNTAMLVGGLIALGMGIAGVAWLFKGNS